MSLHIQVLSFFHGIFPILTASQDLYLKIFEFTKKIDEDGLPLSARKCPISSTNHQWVRAPLMEVSLYPAQTVTKSSFWSLMVIKDVKEEDKCP